MYIISRSLMKIGDKNERYLHYRNESDIRNLIAHVLVSSHPFITGGCGVLSKLTVNSVAEEFLFVQDFYKKTTGVRVRHEYININKSELTEGKEIQQITYIAVMMSKYYLFKGFQNVWGITEGPNSYMLSYAINTVSPFDGSKYHFNKHDILADENAYLKVVWQTAVSDVKTGYDMRKLESYPYSFDFFTMMDEHQS